MPGRPRSALLLYSVLTLLLASAGQGLRAQQLVSESLPDAPDPSAAADPPTRSLPAHMRSSGRPQPQGTLTLGQRFHLQADANLAPFAFIAPLAESGITMAHPPDHYPHDWSDGPGAFGRNYGAELGRHTTAGLTHFAAAAVLREDPRYFPSTRTGFFARTLHMIAFTLVDRSDSGHRTLALSNFAGAVGGGFVGMAWEPRGFDDTTHAYQRSAVEMAGFGTHNLIEEFSPEITRGLRKLHLSKAQGTVLPDSKAPPPDQKVTPEGPKPGSSE